MGTRITGARVTTPRPGTPGRGCETSEEDEDIKMNSNRSLLPNENFKTIMTYLKVCKRLRDFLDKIL